MTVQIIFSSLYSENEVCGVMITRMGDNYDGSNPNLETTNESITRGCVIDTMSSAKPETTIDQSRFFICESGPLCNIFGVDVNPDDISPLPRPGQWNKPLTLQDRDRQCRFDMRSINIISDRILPS